MYATTMRNVMFTMITTLILIVRRTRAVSRGMIGAMGLVIRRTQLGGKISSRKLRGIILAKPTSSYMSMEQA